MNVSRRSFLATAAAGAAGLSCGSSGPIDDGVTRYVRFARGEAEGYGLLKGNQIEPFSGDLFGARTPAGDPVPLAEVKLLYPCKPSKVFALAGNYADHLGADVEIPDHPEPFYKPISCLQNPGDPIVFPVGAREVHYEAEFVIVIGKKAKRVSKESADDYILGYTCGNDISERQWQNGALDGPASKDLQWWRGKGCDTFGPMGPVIATGFNFLESRIQLRQNGEIRQDTTLDHLIHKPAETVAFISNYVTLMPGDVIFTGTSGKTASITHGDKLEVEIDGIGILENTVA